MTFGFRIYSGAMGSSATVENISAQISAAQQDINNRYAGAVAKADALKTAAANYGLRLVKMVSYTSWQDAFFGLTNDGYFTTDWDVNTFPAKPLDPYMADSVFTLRYLAAKSDILGTYNEMKFWHSFYDAMGDYNLAVNAKKTLEQQLKQAKAAMRKPVYDSGSISWNQLDMFLVPANNSTTRSYDYLLGKGFQLAATQTFVNPPPINAKAVAHTISINGVEVTVSGGNQDVYVVVVMQ